VRYLGRRVYLGAVVVLVTAMIGGLTATRVARLRQWLGVSEYSDDRDRSVRRILITRSGES